MKTYQKLLAMGLFIATTVSGCTSEDQRVFLLDEGNNQVLTLASYSELETLVNAETTFMLVVGNATCTCTSTFMSVVRPFVADTGIAFYYLEFTQILNQSNKFGLPVVSPNFPVWGVFEEGNLKHYRAYNSNNTSQNAMFETREAFTTFLEDKVHISSRFQFVNQTELDLLFSNDETFILYFGRHSCTDCSFAFHSFFKDYLNTHRIGPRIYGFEVEKEGVWNAVDGNNTPGWTDFKNNYGLSNVINTTFGYATGFVPTWMVIEPNNSSIAEDPSIIKDMMVVYNDTHVQVDENGTPIRDENNATIPTNQLTRSFFDGTRPLQYTDVNLLAGEGTPFTHTTIRAEYHAQLEPIYTPIMQAFFDMYAE